MKTNGIRLKSITIRGERKQGKKTDEEFYIDLDAFIGDRVIQAIVIDPSAASFIATINKRGKYNVIQAENSVIDGIRNMATALSNRLIFFNDVCINTFREFFSYVWDTKAIERGEDKPVKENDHCLDGDRYFVNTILFEEEELFYVSSSER